MQAGGFMKLRILFPFVLLFTYSCASTSQYVIKPNPYVENPTQARIILERTGSLGGALALDIFDNGNPIGGLGYNQKLMWDRKAGLLKLTGKFGWNSFGPYEFNVKPGHVYYIKAKGGLTSISFELEKVAPTKLAESDQSFSQSAIATSKPESVNKESLPSASISITNPVQTPDIVTPNTERTNPDAIAVVIGNQTYSHKDIPEVSYARNDALMIRKFLVDTLGYKDGNILFEPDTTKAKLEMIFGLADDHRGMLFNYIKPKKSDVFIYYSGHGSPDPNTNRAYLVPTDCNPVMMSLTAYPLDVLYGNLPKIDAKSVTVVLDACFSGGTNTGKWLVQNASPALLKIKNPVTTMNNLTIFTSSENNQISSWYPEKQHSMFTYFFLNAVTGGADFNHDNKISYQEIYDFVADKSEGVPYYAKRLHGGRIQNPTLQTADKDAVFVEF